MVRDGRSVVDVSARCGWARPACSSGPAPPRDGGEAGWPHRGRTKPSPSLALVPRAGRWRAGLRQPGGLAAGSRLDRAMPMSRQIRQSAPPTHRQDRTVNDSPTNRARPTNGAHLQPQRRRPVVTNKTIQQTRRKALTSPVAGAPQAARRLQTNAAGAVTVARRRATPSPSATRRRVSAARSRWARMAATVSQLPTGQYQISRNGAAPRNVTVNVGSAANIDFAGGDATTLDTVTVVGTGAINRSTCRRWSRPRSLTAEQIAKIPVARDTTSVALLAPGTVRGDAAFGNPARSVVRRSPRTSTTSTASTSPNREPGTSRRCRSEAIAESSR